MGVALEGSFISGPLVDVMSQPAMSWRTPDEAEDFMVPAGVIAIWGVSGKPQATPERQQAGARSEPKPGQRQSGAPL